MNFFEWFFLGGPWEWVVAVPIISLVLATISFVLSKIWEFLSGGK